MFRKVENSLKNLMIKIFLDWPAWFRGTAVGFCSKAFHIKNLISELHPVCIALQETHLKPADIAKIKRYCLVRKVNENESGRASGGVAHLVAHDTPSSVITLHTNLQALAVRVMLSNLVTVCTLYLPSSTSVDERDLDRLVDELPAHFIIVGDFNGHSPLWGSNNTNSRGRQIEEFINTHSLCLLNNGEDTYEVELSTLRSSYYARRLFPYFNFRVGVDLHDSDHFPIFLDRSVLTMFNV
ncbi:hypothetical protein AVEN_187053-1 [Araneus ventricosus]|uniref:Endonuclease/exonuclease/phosphatase domain-containing protein n=1 Tax=Araneus ventricosus TaxID=182803 RepID=A0A4Y2VK55_ARAVE|nr:hypothetical protein AVEN_13159-1 [Araneus ventricosus]GBO24717.1 hypothetical protein AVEN_187053-1 [Araneus ventricosus]